MSNHLKIDIFLSFGKRVREIRLSQGLSQEGFAALADLDRSYLGGVERGDRNVSLYNIYKIALALNISLEDLMRGVE
jgi:transcriptional regulator with XRE-family HTH domain